MGRRSPLERVEALSARIAGAETEREKAIALAVAAGCSWAQIGRALGVSGQAAHKRYRWLRHSPATGEIWYEPPLPV
jgi:DNA-binding CsgD family transcriptional regulator